MIDLKYHCNLILFHTSHIQQYRLTKDFSNKMSLHWSTTQLFSLSQKFSSMFRLRVDIEVHNAKSDKQNEREQRDKNVICVGGLDFERDDFFFIFRALISKSWWTCCWNTDMPCIYLLDASKVCLSTWNDLI